MRRALIGLIAPLFVLVGVIGLLASPASAQTYGPGGSTGTASVSGNTITVSGTINCDNCSLNFYIESTPIFLGTGTSNATGAFTATFPLPAGLAAGNHTVIVNASNGATLSIPVFLAVGTGAPATPAATPAAGTPSSSSSLPFTGANAATGITAGAIAILVGGLVVLSTRRRRKAWGSN